ncbi:hypothetical protein MP228_009784 [Amoeboaphelidium protococcarum]|nr:hypothetical protein MP228_009784 [Amoeboaphelidium protococcarum]
MGRDAPQGMVTLMVQINGRLTAIENRLTAIENRLIGIEERVTRIEGRMDNIEERKSTAAKDLAYPLCQTTSRLSITLNLMNSHFLPNMYELSRIQSIRTLRLHACTKGARLQITKYAQPAYFGFFNELGSHFRSVADDSDVRAIILTGGESKHFTAGLDLTDKALFEIISGGECTGRRGLSLRSLIDRWQKAVTAVAQCQKPVIACVHGACIGGGVDLIAAADLRFCTKDAYFSVKEVDIGLAADLGSIQRLTKIIGHHGKLREWCYTGRNISSDEALQYGLVNGIYETKDEMMKQVQLLAEQIAAKSPIAIRGTKVSLEHALDHSVQEGLDFIKNWNMTMLQSEDLQKSVMSVLNKDTNVKFSKL